MRITRDMIIQCPDLSRDERKVLLYVHHFAGKRIRKWIEGRLPRENYQGLLSKASKKLHAFKETLSQEGAE